MEIDEQEVVDESSEESEDDEDDTVEVKALKVVFSESQLTRWLFRLGAATYGLWCNQQSMGSSLPCRHLLVAVGIKQNKIVVSYTCHSIV